MEAFGYIGAGVILLVAESFPTQHHVRPAQAFERDRYAHQSGQRTVPSWVSLVVRAGWGSTLIGIVRGSGGSLS